MTPSWVAQGPLPLKTQPPLKPSPRLLSISSEMLTLPADPLLTAHKIFYVLYHTTHVIWTEWKYLPHPILNKKAEVPKCCVTHKHPVNQARNSGCKSGSAALLSLCSVFVIAFNFSFYFYIKAIYAQKWWNHSIRFVMKMAVPPPISLLWSQQLSPL